jgi:hypothetical protein
LQIKPESGRQHFDRLATVPQILPGTRTLLNGTVMMFNITVGNVAAQPVGGALERLRVLAADPAGRKLRAQA